LTTYFPPLLGRSWSSRGLGILGVVALDLALVGDKVDTDKRLEHLGHLESLGRLVVFDEAAQGALGGCEGRVEAVDILLLLVAGLKKKNKNKHDFYLVYLFLAAADLHTARLVVGAVGARHELAVVAKAGEPGLEIVLFGSGVIESARDDADDAVRDLELQLGGGEFYLFVLF